MSLRRGCNYDARRQRRGYHLDCSTAMLHDCVYMQVHGCDGESLPINAILNAFDSKKCPALAGKPKLFFIQACRGGEHEWFLKGLADNNYSLPGRINWGYYCDKYRDVTQQAQSRANDANASSDNGECNWRFAHC